MKVTFITNYLTHHQLPFAEEMYRLLGEDFTFLATNAMEKERIAMGWQLDPGKYPFVKEHDADYGLSEHLIMDSDVLICGGTHFSYIEKRVEQGKLTFRYFERLYKKGRQYAFLPSSYIRKWKEHTKYRKEPVYLLCAGAYVASDFRLFFSYPGKMLKWGYFPQFILQDEERLKEKKKEKNTILWTGRMLDWKHATDAIKALALLKKQGMDFHFTMIGEGEEEAVVRRWIKKQALEDKVTLLPFQKPEVIRDYMEKSRIYLMTSDFEEGWGAVVNEAMNSGCAVVASAGAGSVPYLIQHGKNGLVYRNGNVKELAEKIGILLKDEALQETLGKNAYQTIKEEWNAKRAAKDFLTLCEKLVRGEYSPKEEGTLSPAPVLSPAKGYSYCKK